MYFLLISAAMDYLMANPDEAVNIKALEEAAGVGVVVTPDQIEEAVSMNHLRGTKKICIRNELSFGSVYKELKCHIGMLQDEY